MEDSIYLNGEYVSKNPTYHEEDSSWKAQFILKMLRKHQLDVRSICEVGCGAGEILRYLQMCLPDEMEFFGYEISPQGFDRCQPKANKRLHYYCQDLLSTQTELFDLMLCMDVFEHVEDYMGFLRKLRPKARFKIFHIPLDMSAQWVFRGSPVLLAREKVGHLHYFSKETALATLRDTGYEILDWIYTPADVDKPGSLKCRMMRWPRKFFTGINADLSVRILGGYSLLVHAR